jgi:hypothetical protein
MRFQHTQTRDDGGGTLTVYADGRNEVYDLARHFNVFKKDDPDELIKFAEALKAGKLEYQSPPEGRRPWYLVKGRVNERFVEPYWQLLKRITGHEGHFDLHLTNRHPNRLCHTHMTLACSLATDYLYEIIIQAEDWNGKAAADRAVANALDYAEECLGYRPHEREFVQKSNGAYYQNPNYLKRHSAKPGLGAPWLWETIFGAWRYRPDCATDEQRSILDEADAAKAAVKLIDSDYILRRSGGDCAHLVGCAGLYLSYKEPVRHMTWEQFAAMGRGVTK